MDASRMHGAHRTLTWRMNRRRLLASTLATATVGQLRIGTPGVTNATMATQLEPADHVQAVVTAYAVATEAGLEMLAQGGTAADAAIGVASVLSVVEPWFSSCLGDDTWGLYFDAGTRRVTSLDGVGPVGSNTTRAAYAERAEDPGIHNAIVPGAWDGWMLWLDRYGRLDLGQVLAPAIRVAREGYPASDDMAFWLDRLRDEILASPDAARIYAPRGTILRAGDTVYQRDMANTFDALVRAYDGAASASRTDAVQAARDYFYRGPLAEAIVAFSDQHDVYPTQDDFRYLYLRGGEWDGHQIVDQAWVDASTREQASGTSSMSGVNVGGGGSYGYQWWIKELYGYLAYYGNGYGGQTLYVVPDLDLVVVTAVAGTHVDEPYNQQPVLPIIEELIVPAAIDG